MGEPLLRTLLVVEFGILGGLFGLLLLWPLIRRAIRTRREARQETLLTALREGTPGGEHPRIRRALSRSRPGALLRALETAKEEGIATEDLPLRELIRDGTAFRRIERAARSIFWWRRQTAARLLGGVARPPDDHEIFVRLLRDSHPAVSAAALLSAQELRWPSLVEPLLDLAAWNQADPWGEAELLVNSLSALDADVVPAMEERLREAEGGDAEVPLLQTAARIGDARLRPVLVDRLHHGGLEVRIQAARTLSAVGDPAAADALREALEDPAWQVRTQAARALGELGREDAIPDLRRALSDPSWWVRLRAALALRKLGPDGQVVLDRVDPADDRYAAEMARYVLGLDDAALEEYAR